MSGIWRLVHFLSFTAWIGGGLAAMVAGIAMKRLDRSLWGGVVEVQGAIYRTMVGPGAFVAIFSGIIMTLGIYHNLSGQAGPWIGMMQGCGLIGALVALLGAMPAALKLSRLEPLGPEAAAFDALRKRLAITGSISGTLALLALIAGAFYRTA